MKTDTKNNVDTSRLPHNRWEVFEDRIKTHWWRLLLCGLVLLTFALPFFAVRLFADLSVLTLAQRHDAAEITDEQYKQTLAMINLAVPLFNIVSHLVFAVGLSGVMRQIRQLAWSQSTPFWKDFVVGVKQNVGGYLIVFLIVGVLNGANVATMQLNLGFLSYVPMCMFVIVILPIALHALVQIAVYKHKFWSTFTNSALVYFKTIPLSFLAALVATAYMWFDSFPSFVGRYVAKVVFVIVLPIGILAWFLYVCSALDKYLNAQNYPDLVDRGVWRV